MKNTLTTMMAGAATVAAVTAGSAFMAAPAEAVRLTVGDTVGFGTGVSITNLGDGSWNFVFPNTATNPAIGDEFTGTDQPPFLIGDPVIKSLGTIQEGVAFDLPSFITGIALTEDGVTSPGDVSFNITRGILTRSGNSLDLRFIGTFEGIANAKGRGEFTTQFLPSPGNTVSRQFSTNISVVPTPAAVLPGLIGMGTAVFRKKKQDDGADVAAEPAEANA